MVAATAAAARAAAAAAAASLVVDGAAAGLHGCVFVCLSVGVCGLSARGKSCVCRIT